MEHQPHQQRNATHGVMKVPMENECGLDNQEHPPHEQIKMTHGVMKVPMENGCG